MKDKKFLISILNIFIGVLIVCFAMEVTLLIKDHVSEFVGIMLFTSLFFIGITISVLAAYGCPLIGNNVNEVDSE